MNAGLASLERYIDLTLGTRVDPTPWDGSGRLPFFLRNLYDYFEVTILQAPFLLMLDRSEQEHPP